MGRKIVVAAVLTLVAVMLAVAAIPDDSEASSKKSGYATNGDVTVQYSDSSDPEHGILKVSFGEYPGDDSYTIAIDGGDVSSDIPVRTDAVGIRIPSLDEGIHIIHIDCGGNSWNIEISIVINVESVTLDKSSIVLREGETIRIIAVVEPSDVSDGGVTWRSGDSSIARVSQNGTVTAVSEGRTTITATAGGISAVCRVTVEHIHSWGQGTVTTEPTCTEPGTRTYVCSCGDVTTESIPALGHDWSDWIVTKEATAHEEGSESRTCSRCGDVETRAIPKLPGHDHVWGEGTVTLEPSCSEQGVRTFTCTDCGETRTENIPALGHDWSDTSGDGYTERTCKRCGLVERTQVNEDGSNTNTVTDPDGSVTKITEGAPDGSKTVEKITTAPDGSGNYVKKSESVRTEADGSTTTTSSSSVSDAGGTLLSSETTVVSKDEGTGTSTVASSRTDSSGRVTSESTTTIVAEPDATGSSSRIKVSDESVDAAMKQISSVSDLIPGAEKVIRIESGGIGATSETVAISQSSIAKISERSDASLDLTASSVNLVLDSGAVSNLKDKGDVAVSVDTGVKSALSDRQKELVGDSLVLDILLTAGGSEVHELNGRVTVAIPYVRSESDVGNLEVWYLDGDNLVWVGDVDYRDGIASFTITHLSKYVISEKTVQPEPAKTDSENSDILLYAVAAIIVVLVATVCVVLYKRRV